MWSFWTKPFLAHRAQIWTSVEHHFYSWVLSLETARRHYPDTVLYTDDFGASLLIDCLGLSFAKVSTELNGLADMDAGWWAAGKLYAYSRQTKPFVHIDSDVYCWKQLPAAIEDAPVFAQNPERVVLGRSCYNPVSLENALHKRNDTWLPPEWEFYRRQGVSQYALCCGILGGQDTEFLRHYARQALRMIEYTPNREALKTFPEKVGQTILIEQYLLAACIENGGHAEKVQCLFRSQRAAYRPEESQEKGYTHLLADAKRNIQVNARLKERVRVDYPKYYERCREAANLAAIAQQPQPASFLS